MVRQIDRLGAVVFGPLWERVDEPRTFFFLLLFVISLIMLLMVLTLMPCLLIMLVI
jgi:hypothetical protein